MQSSCPRGGVDGCIEEAIEILAGVSLERHKCMAYEARRGLFEDGNSSDGESVCSPRSAGSSLPAALDSDEGPDDGYLAQSEQGGGVGTLTLPDLVCLVCGVTYTDHDMGRGQLTLDHLGCSHCFDDSGMQIGLLPPPPEFSVENRSHPHFSLWFQIATLIIKSFKRSGTSYRDAITKTMQG